MIKSPFIHNEPVMPPIFAGRKDELNLINTALFDDKESLVLYGNDAIGKSSIVRTIHNELIHLNTHRILPVKINAFDFIKAVEDNFLGMVTHQICATIWTKLIRKTYSELIEDTLINVSGEILNSPEEKSIKRIFRIVTSDNLTGKGKSIKEIGTKFLLEGKISHESEVINIKHTLAPFEFLHLLDELNDIINVYNYSSIMVFCDELNHLPSEVNADILRNYFSIFSSKKIQFVIIAVNPEISHANDARNLIESFNYSLEIGTFKDVSCVSELVQNSISTLSTEFEFENGIYEYLFRKTNGHPWWIQKICDKAFKLNENEFKICLNSFEISGDFYRKEIDIYNERVKAGLPFRKYNLIFNK